MECIRCGEEGAERTEIEFASGAVVVMYVCPNCSEEETHRQNATEYTSSSNP